MMKIMFQSENSNVHQESPDRKIDEISEYLSSSFVIFVDLVNRFFAIYRYSAVPNLKRNCLQLK